MYKHKRIIQSLSLLAALVAVTGCGVDQVDRKIDQASEHISLDKPFYEGTLTAAQAVGAMVSLQFADGQIYEVAKTPTPFVPGDVVRIYKTDKGYEAHLWRASKDAILPAGNGRATK